MQRVFETCRPRDEVLTGELREEIFAARLKDVMDGKADPVYGGTSVFFPCTYPKSGLKHVLDTALGSLLRAVTDQVLQALRKVRCKTSGLLGGWQQPFRPEEEARVQLGLLSLSAGLLTRLGEHRVYLARPAHHVVAGSILLLQ
jgi:hypothetical protein